MSDNKVYRNNFLNNGEQIYATHDAADIFYQNPPIGGNYWSDFDELSEGCIDLNSNGFCDFSYVFNENSQDNYPWTKQNGWKVSTNQPTTIFNFNQYKSDGQTLISEEGITAESTVVFRATVNDSDNDQVKLQVELKEFNQPFDETGLIESDLVSSGSEAAITRYGLIPASYHWRAKAVDDKGNVSDWQEFGTAGNVDFEVKLVPLYTQVFSKYPSEADTDEWDGLGYAKGFTETYGCGSTIENCGCAIASIVMIARYHLDEDVAQGKDINPGTINEWLKNEQDGYFDGDVNGIAAAKYTSWRIKYEKTDTNINNYALLDEKINSNQPVIAKANSSRGGINRQHFFVVDNKLTLTYGVKDPAWYNTKKLNETTDSTNKIRGYENGFDGLRIYKKGDGIAQSGITIALGSPAELLLTDSQGRKLGKDENGIEYGEIPNASYFQDGFDSPFGENLSPQERNKLIQILEPIDGDYQLQVIGAGEGDYSLSSNFYDTQGNVNHQEFHSETALGYTAQYNLSFDSSNSINTTIELFDETSPEAEIFFNSDTKELEIKGIDNITVNPEVSIISENKKQATYQIKDEAGNTTKFFFDKIKQEGKEIKAELEAIQYNNEPIIKTEAEFKYEWSLDKNGIVKELEQRIKVEDNFDIKAEYNHQRNEIEIKIKQKNKEEIKQIFPGLIIVKLITKSGVLSFEF